MLLKWIKNAYLANRSTRSSSLPSVHMCPRGSMVRGYRAGRGSRSVSRCTLQGSCSDTCPPHSHTHRRSCKERESGRTRWRLVCRFGLRRRVCSGRGSRNQRDYTDRRWHKDLRHKDQLAGSFYLANKSVLMSEYALQMPHMMPHIKLDCGLTWPAWWAFTLVIVDAGEFTCASVSARGAKAHVIGGSEAQSVRVAQAAVADKVHLVGRSHQMAHATISALGGEARVAELARRPGELIEAPAEWKATIIN